ncbi:zinc finger RNA-binding protein 2 isoform X2 [Anthonomus grandis grandis]|uniref:zinc finger RNA-binding protein 2 isoform X2 n=1 Tax=Anthonomus grandis grandis TaxID=2921223 RepID=UPI0021658DDB|nr:zinc finger RNA-binding protein 2 isoform X2 [Anthonomus grandis grandis]
MATNNYFGFTHGGTQYSATPTGAAYQAAGQPGYTVAAAPAPGAAATYGAQRPAGYDTAYQTAAQGTYAAVGGATPAYEYGYGQTAAPTYAPGYEQAAAGKTATYATTYATQRAATQQAQATAAAKPAQYAATYQPNATAYQASYAQPAAQTTIATQPTTQAKANSGTYSGYDAALYSAATMYVAQQQGGVAAQSAAVSQAAQKPAGWQGFKRGAGGNKGQRPKQPPKPQQLHYCDVCKISCAGPQTYREHLEGQKHKKREAATKMAASVATTNANRSGNSLRCQLCDVTCTGNDAYAAHIRGAKHQKVVLLHTKLGKPIPPQEPEIIGGAKKSIANAPKINFVQSGGLGIPPQQGSNGEPIKEEEEDTPEPDIQPVGQDYIEEIKSEDGKVMSFNCKLCECRFNDPNAKEMHMKGRRHRLQYKKKVNPDLVVDVKPSLRQKKMQEEKLRRAAMREEFWARRHGFNMEDEESMYWEDRRRYEEYMDMMNRGGGFPRGRPFPGGPPPFGFPPGPGHRRVESSDDRHVMVKHAEIYPKEEELQIVQRIVSHTERALKLVSDQLAESKTGDAEKEKPTEQPQKEDGRDNQLFSFQKEQDASRMLRGVMRVGNLAKGLLLKGDNNVELVVLCADKPTLTLLKKVVELLPASLKVVSPDSNYQVQINPAEAGLTVQADGITVLVQLTSPVMREQAASGGTDRDVLSRGKCLQALAALRHTKWFQARALGLHSCVILIRILRDLCVRVPTWSPLSSWAMELLAEKVISSTPGQAQLSPGDALRRVMEAVAGGLLLPGGPGLADPCEKDGPDASGALTAQQREDLTCSSQYALRLISFRQMYKVLGTEPLPPPQKPFRRDRSARKRRRSGGEQEGSESSTGSFTEEVLMSCPLVKVPSQISVNKLLENVKNHKNLEENNLKNKPKIKS